MIICRRVKKARLKRKQIIPPNIINKNKKRKYLQRKIHVMDMAWNALEKYENIANHVQVHFWIGVEKKCWFFMHKKC